MNEDAGKEIKKNLTHDGSILHQEDGGVRSGKKEIKLKDRGNFHICGKGLDVSGMESV